MAIDDDITRSLPEPPPPRPARRDAAIEEALRRFDGEPPRTAPRPRPAAPPWRAWLGRPQAGLLVTAALVAAIGVPTALISIGERFSAAGPETPARIAERAATPGAAARAPGVRPSPPIMADMPPPSNLQARPEPVPAAPPAALADSAPGFDARDAGDAKAVASAAPHPAPAMKMAPVPAPAPVPVAAPPPPPAPRADITVAGRQDRFAERREQSPQAMTAQGELSRFAAGTAAKVAAADSTDIVVTGSAVRPVRRGDWNACTVNDPGRTLNRCRNLVDPAAKGPAGRAAARLADGLSLAWQGDFDKAITAFDQAIEIEPRLAFAYLNRGLAHQRSGDLDLALADLDRAVRYAPNARGYYNRGLVLRQRGDARRANLDGDRAVELDSRYEAVVK